MLEHKRDSRTSWFIVYSAFSVFTQRIAHWELSLKITLPSRVLGCHFKHLGDHTLNSQWEERENRHQNVVMRAARTRAHHYRRRNTRDTSRRLWNWAISALPHRDNELRNESKRKWCFVSPLHTPPSTPAAALAPRLHEKFKNCKLKGNSDENSDASTVFAATTCCGRSAN